MLLPNGGTLQYNYDADGNLTNFIDTLGKTVRYVYDDNGNMTEWYDQNNERVVKNTYDADGRVTEQINPNNEVVKLAYSTGKTVTTDAEGNV
ncbi:hypothetical protein C1X30_31795, partial [Pseudomonas sp. FW305-BF6]